MKIDSLYLIVVSMSLLLTPVTYAALTNIDGGQIVTVPGTQTSPWDEFSLAVGYSSTGTLNISNSGVVNNSFGYIGENAGSIGIANVSGAGSQWTQTIFSVGTGGHGTLTISDGGIVNNSFGYIGENAGSIGIVEVSDAGSQWNSTQGLFVGDSGNAMLTIRDGGVVTSVTGFIGNSIGSSGIVEVSGLGAEWNNTTGLTIGRTGNGTLTIREGGKANNTNSYIGRAAGATGIVDVIGAGSQWNNSSTLSIAESGNGTLTIADEATVSASSVTIASNAASSGTLNIGNGNLAGTLNTASITGGAGAAIINFNHIDNIDFSPQMSGSLTVNKINNGITTLTAVNSYTGITTVSAGALRAGTAGAFSNQSDFVTEASGRLDLAGYDQIIASLNNAGVVSFNGVPGAVLTITGDYMGNNGLLSFNTALHDDNSTTDRLVVEGNTSGTTQVSITNAGGGGAATLNGIELIQVNGLSEGEFIKNGRIVAGAYDYSLARGVGSNAANWYLTSTETPTIQEPGAPMIERPEAGGYTANLAVANTMFVTRLHDRLGETQYIDAQTGEKKVTSLWLRNEGGHNRSRDSQDQLRTQSNRYVLQLGGDIAQWSHNERDRFHLGIMAGYGNSKSKTESRLSDYSARASVDGYSTGVYGTWYANDTDKSGWYADSWAQYSWFNNTVNGQNLVTEEYQSHGLTASVESGYTFNIGENTVKNAQYFIQPKAQVTWMGVKADNHKEANGTNISGDGEGNIQTRLGVKAFMSGYAEQDKGKDRVFQPFIEANWIHNTRDFGTNMDGITVKQDGAANIAELKMGIEGQINKQVNLWGNVGQQIGNKGYSDTAAMLGVKYNF
ncbi:autotransporter outer membrane beta-barrel domain-containing protein [Yersinia enterocolitica]|nr:autotransporter outer membrane beta-barrel domain-containing protein [Yersinia enterocolitica]PNM27174.1 autotransporter outer membrane beta-barrel domain-containing protein [Yersinia enterocolitica]